MPRVIEKTVFKFDELSDKAKQAARDWCREWIGEDWTPLDDSDWLEETAKLLGIDLMPTKDVHYCVGDCSGGDFVTFAGSWTYRPEAVDAIAKERPTDAELLRIANELQRAWTAVAMAGGTMLTADMTTRSTGCHSEAMDVEVESDIELRDGCDPDDCLIPQFAIETVGECMTDFAHWMLTSFQADWEWTIGDENIDETLVSNEYEFDEDGDRV